MSFPLNANGQYDPVLNKGDAVTGTTGGAVPQTGEYRFTSYVAAGTGTIELKRKERYSEDFNVIQGRDNAMSFDATSGSEGDGFVEETVQLREGDVVHVEVTNASGLEAYAYLDDLRLYRQ